MRDDARAVQPYEAPSIEDRTPPEPYVAPRIVARDPLDVPLIATDSPGDFDDASAAFRPERIAEE